VNTALKNAADLEKVETALDTKIKRIIKELNL